VGVIPFPRLPAKPRQGFEAPSKDNPRRPGLEVQAEEKWERPPPPPPPRNMLTHVRAPAPAQAHRWG
jgi:hypothetical protein